MTVDGIEIVASLVLLADRRARRPSGWLPWAALAIGTAGSLAANVATAGNGIVSRVIAGWPALALLIAVKLLSGMLYWHDSPNPAEGPSSSGWDPSGGDTSSPVSVRDSPADVALPAAAAAAAPVQSSGDPADRKTAPDAGTVAGINDLLPAARAARDALLKGGTPLTRDSLAAWLRTNGHPVGNSRVTLLLRVLRSEVPGQAPTAA